MIHTLVECDLCEARQQPGVELHWEQNFHGGFFCPGNDGVNHATEFTHLCRDCRVALNVAIKKVIRKREVGQG